MTKYFTQWDDDTIGSAIAGFTTRTHFSGGTPTFVPAYGSPTVLPHKKRYLVFTTGNAASLHVASQNALDSDANRDKFSIVIGFNEEMCTTERILIYARGQGTSPLTDCYMLQIRFDINQIHIDKTVAGVLTSPISAVNYTFAPATAYYARFEGNGTALKARVWDAALGAEGEPTTWDISITDSSITAAGWIGIGAYHATLATRIAAVNFFAVGTNGDSAVAPRSNTEYNTWLDDQTVQRCVLAEMSAVAYDSTDATDYAGTKTFYSSNIGFISAQQDSPSVTFYDPIIRKIPTFSREMSIALSGKASVAFGSISITNPRETGLPENYLLLDGVAGSYASTPDSVANSVTGDIDIRVRLSMDDWTPAAIQYLIAKYNSTPTGSYLVSVTATGLIKLEWVDSASTVQTADSTVATGIANGTAKSIRVTMDVNNGAAGRDIKFYTSVDGITYTQLGATVTQAGTTSIQDGADKLTLGAFGDAGANSPLAGKIYRAEVYNGIGGTLVDSFNTSVTVPGSTSFNSTDTGELWTINGTAKIAQTEYNVGGVRDNWLRMKWKKDYVKIYLGDPTWSKHDFHLVLLGRLDGPTSDGVDAMSFAISDLLDKLDRPFQTNVLGGGDGVINKYVPVLIGEQGGFIDPVRIDDTLLRYKIHDGGIHTIGSGGSLDVYDEYVSLMDSSGKTISAVNAATNTLTASAAHGLVAGSVVGFPGNNPLLLPAPLDNLNVSYCVITAGLTATDFRLSSTHGGAEIDITGTTTGAGFYSWGFRINTGGTFDLAAKNAGRILCGDMRQAEDRVTTEDGGLDTAGLSDNVNWAIFTKFGLSKNFRDKASFNALSTNRCGAWFGTDKVTALEVLHELCSGVQSWYGFTPDGLLQIGRLDLPVTVASMSFTVDDVKFGSLRLKSRILPLDFTQCNVYGEVSKLTGGQLQNRATSISEKLAILRITAPSLGAPIDTPYQGDCQSPRDFNLSFAVINDAIDEQTRLKTLYAKQIGVFEFQTRLSATRLSIGETISLTHERAGWKQWGGSDPASPDNTGTIDSRLAVVIGIDTDLSANSPFPVKLTVFRQIPQYAYQIA